MSRSLRLRLTETAEADLAEIWAYIAAGSSKTVATRLLGKIEAVFSHLTLFSNSGAARGSLAPKLRVTFAGKYAIYHCATETEVIVVRVLHGARDISAIVDNEGFAF